MFTNEWAVGIIVLWEGLKGEGEEEESEKMDIGGEKWERMQERVLALEVFLGIATETEAKPEGATQDAATGPVVPKPEGVLKPPASAGGLTVIRDDVALLKHKLGDFETLLQYFPMENLLEALRDLEELRNKLLRKTSQSG